MVSWSRFATRIFLSHNVEAVSARLPGNLAEGVLLGHFVAGEFQEIATADAHTLAACVGSHEVPLERSDVARHLNLQILKLAVGKTVEESLTPRRTSSRPR